MSAAEHELVYLLRRKLHNAMVIRLYCAHICCASQIYNTIRYVKSSAWTEKLSDGEWMV